MEVDLTDRRMIDVQHIFTVWNPAHSVPLINFIARKNW